MNENDISSVQNTEQPVTTVNEPLQNAAPVVSPEPVTPVVENTTPVAEPVQAPVSEPQVQTPEPTIDTAPTVQPPLQSIGDPIVEEKKKSKLPIIIILVILLIGVGVLVYFLFFKKVTGKQVVNGTINKFFATAETFSEKLDDAFIFDFKSETIKANGYLKGSIETSDQNIKNQLNGLQSVAIKYDLQINAKDLEGYLNISGNENDKEIITFSSMLKDKILYMESNVFDKVYKQDLTNEVDWEELKERIKEVPEYDSRTISKVTKKIKEYLKKSIKDEYISLEEGTFTVDGVELKGSKTTLTLTEKRVNEMTISMLNSAKNDSEMVEMLAKCANQSKEQVIKELEDIAKEIENQNEYANTESKLYINIYTTTKGKFLGLEVKVQNDVVATAVSQNDITTIKIKMDQEIKLTYDEKKKELTWVNEAEDNNNEKIVVTFKEDAIKIEATYKQYKVTLESEYKNSKTMLSEKNSISVESQTDNGNVKGTIEASAVLEKGNEIKKIDTTNAKDINELTQEENQQIEQNINSQLNKSIVFKLVEQIFKSINQAYLYDYTETNDIYNSMYCSQAYNCRNCSGGYCTCDYTTDQGFIDTVTCSTGN